jgi:hypothetical protein
MVKPPVDVGPENGALSAELKCCDVDGGKRKPVLLKNSFNNYEQLFTVAMAIGRQWPDKEAIQGPAAIPVSTRSRARA